MQPLLKILASIIGLSLLMSLAGCARPTLTTSFRVQDENRNGQICVTEQQTQQVLPATIVYQPRTPAQAPTPAVNMALPRQIEVQAAAPAAFRPPRPTPTPQPPVSRQESQRTPVPAQSAALSNQAAPTRTTPSPTPPARTAAAAPLVRKTAKPGTPANTVKPAQPAKRVTPKPAPPVPPQPAPAATTAPDRSRADSPEARAIARARQADTYREYARFAEEWPQSAWADDARARTTPDYWQQQAAREPSAHGYEQLAAALIAEQGELGYRAAEAAYRRALELDPLSAAVHLGLGKHLFENARYQETIDLLATMPPQAETAAAAYYLAKAQASLKHYRAALESFSQAVAREPDNAQYLYERGYAYWQQGRFQEAKTDFQRVVQLQPESILATVARKYLKPEGSIQK